MSYKMNKNLSCFIRAIRQMQACPSAMSSSRAVVRTYGLGTNRHKNAAQSLYLRGSLLYVSPCWLQSSARFFSQDSFNIESTNANEQGAVSDLLNEQTQSSSSVTEELATSPPGPTVTAEIDSDSAGEETDESTVSQQYFGDIQKCASPSDILDLIARYPLTLKLISHSLAAMWMLTKRLSEDQKRYERQLMFQHPQFSQLCLSTMHGAKNMWHSDLAYNLHAIIRLGVPQNTRLVQTMLRACQERLNEFDDRSISVVASALQGMEMCKNVEALHTGLQLLVEQRIPHVSNLFILQNMMRCLGGGSSHSLRTKLENKILNQIDELTVPNALNMFVVLAEMNFCSLRILNACADKITENIEGTPFWRLLKILRSCNILRYRDAAFFSAIADYIASSFYMWDTRQIVLFLSAFENLTFRPARLMDALAEKVISHPDSLTMRDILALLRAYSVLNHLPGGGQDQQFLQALNGALTKYLPRILNLDLLRAVYSFCILGYLPQPALYQLQQDEVLRDLTDEQNLEQNKMMLHVVNACLSLEGHAVPKPAIDLSSEKQSSPHFCHFPEIQELLFTLVGNPTSFQLNAKLTYGGNRDFEILIDDNIRKAVPDSEADQPADDSRIQRVAVLCAPASAFCFGSKHPLGRLAVKMRHLRLLGYHVVLARGSKMATADSSSKISKMEEKLGSSVLEGEEFPSEHHLGSD